MVRIVQEINEWLSRQSADLFSHSLPAQAVQGFEHILKQLKSTPSADGIKEFQKKGFAKQVSSAIALML